MTQARKRIAALVSASLVLLVGATLWVSLPKQERVIDLAPQQGAQR